MATMNWEIVRHYNTIVVYLNMGVHCVIILGSSTAETKISEVKELIAFHKENISTETIGEHLLDYKISKKHK